MYSALAAFFARDLVCKNTHLDPLLVKKWGLQ